VVFETKPTLAVRLLQRAAAARVAFGWVVADEVYGRGAALRNAVEALGKGYVLAVPANFHVRLPIGVYSVRELVNVVPEANWQQRSCGRGCKGHRWYQWAWVATARAQHWVLIRRHPGDPTQLAYFYCHAPGGATLAALVRVAGQRWPVETCIQHGKGLGIDAHQVRRWDSWHRHTALTLAANAMLAIACAKPDPERPAVEPAGQPEPPTASVSTLTGTGMATLTPPAPWRETAPLPHTPDQNPPDDLGMIGVTVPEARRLFNLASTITDLAALTFYLGWSDWRREHQARARWHHHRTRLRQDAGAPP
jgi:hypothetical protein